MCTESKKAVELYKQACAAEEAGELNLAEVYYLKSWAMFEQAGGRHTLNAANALNSLALLRRSRGNYAGATASAKQSLRITEEYRARFKSIAADLIHRQAWELVHNPISCEFSASSLLPSVA